MERIACVYCITLPIGGMHWVVQCSSPATKRFPKKCLNAFARQHIQSTWQTILRSWNTFDWASLAKHPESSSASLFFSLICPPIVFARRPPIMEFACNSETFDVVMWRLETQQTIARGSNFYFKVQHGLDQYHNWYWILVNILLSDVWLRLWSWILVEILKLGLAKIWKFKFLWRYWCLVEIFKLRLGRDSEDEI